MGLKWKIAILIITATIQIISGIAILFNNKMWPKASYSKVSSVLFNGWIWMAGDFFFYGSLFYDEYASKSDTSNIIGGLLFMFLFAYLPSCAGLRGVIGTVGDRAGITFYSEAYEG